MTEHPLESSTKCEGKVVVVADTGDACVLHAVPTDDNRVENYQLVVDVYHFTMMWRAFRRT